MRTSLFLVFLLSFSLFGQDIASPPNKLSPDTSVKIEISLISICGCGLETHYAGGHAALFAFVNDNISFPDDIHWGDLQKVKAYVQFVVEKDGSLSEIHVIHTNFPEVNEYILSAFHMMKNWVAGENKCMTVRTNVRIPIIIILK